MGLANRDLHNSCAIVPASTASCCTCTPFDFKQVHWSAAAEAGSRGNHGREKPVDYFIALSEFHVPMTFVIVLCLEPLCQRKTTSATIDPAAVAHLACLSTERHGTTRDPARRLAATPLHGSVQYYGTHTDFHTVSTRTVRHRAQKVLRQRLSQLHYCTQSQTQHHVDGYITVSIQRSTASANSVTCKALNPLPIH